VLQDRVTSSGRAPLGRFEPKVEVDASVPMTEIELLIIDHWIGVFKPETYTAFIGWRFLRATVHCKFSTAPL